jgi:hypothetical protein
MARAGMPLFTALEVVQMNDETRYIARHCKEFS